MFGNGDCKVSHCPKTLRKIIMGQYQNRPSGKGVQ